MPPLKNKALLTFKPDMEDAAKRWEAYWQRELTDRPVVRAECWKDGFTPKKIVGYGYYENVHSDIDELLDNALYNAGGRYYAGESIPNYFSSFGPDEIAAFCGGTLQWHEDSMGTNWSAPFVEDWETALPLALDREHPLWLRMVTLAEKSAERFGGKLLSFNVDYHSNMDILLAARGAENLCMDLLDAPELIDRAMENARAIFKELWDETRRICQKDRDGFYYDGYSEQSVCVLSCDFCCMVGQEMFRRWVLPTLEYEASLVDHSIYHWDGPRALTHYEDLMSVSKIHTLSFVPDPFERHMKYVDLYKDIQSRGKSVSVWGPPDELKLLHRELDPTKTMYMAQVETPAEADAILDWFAKNT